jgi:single-strand DNA-binding protein
VVAWGDGLVGMIEKRLHKGDAILVTGENRTRKWEKDGQTHYSTEVVMGPNDTLRFVSVKGAKDDEAGYGATDEDRPE